MRLSRYRSRREASKATESCSKCRFRRHVQVRPLAGDHLKGDVIKSAGAQSIMKMDAVRAKWPGTCGTLGQARIPWLNRIYLACAAAGRLAGYACHAALVDGVRLALSPLLNHWWHATLYVNARGLTVGDPV
jgi:hypothetical protein